MDVWFENYAKIKVRPSSHQTYRGYIDNHIKPNIGSIPLSKLSSLDLQKFYKKLLSGGRVERIKSKKQPKGLSPKTVRNINQVISSSMDFARDQRLLAANPTDGCALPKLEHREMKTLPAEQLVSSLQEAKESGVFELYYIELATGLRRGERLGLKWKDIDLEHGSLWVRSCCQGYKMLLSGSFRRFLFRKIRKFRRPYVLCSVVSFPVLGQVMGQGQKPPSGNNSGIEA